MVYPRAAPLFFPPQPEPPNRPSEKERRAAAKRKIVEQNIELGRKLVALRDAMPNNRRFRLPRTSRT